MQSIDSRDSSNDAETRRLIEAYLGIEAPSFSGLTKVMCILFSAKLGQHVKSAQKNYVEILHQLYVGNNRKNLILMFLITAKAYGHEIAFNGMALKEDKISHKKKEILRSGYALDSTSVYDFCRTIKLAGLGST